MQMTTEEIEDAIVAQLSISDGLRDIRVEPFPARWEKFLMTAPKSAVLVHYAGSQRQPSRTGKSVLQARKMTWGLTVVHRNLRGHTGAYALLDAAIAALSGFVIAGCSQMQPTRDWFAGEKDGLWMYAMEFACSQIN